MRFLLWLSGHRCESQIRLAARHLSDSAVCISYEQACLTFTADSLAAGVCFVSETRNQDSSSLTQFIAPYISSSHFVHTSDHEATRFAGQCGVGSVPADKAGASLPDWIPVDSRLCVMGLYESVGVRIVLLSAAYLPSQHTLQQIIARTPMEVSFITKWSLSSSQWCCSGSREF